MYTLHAGGVGRLSDLKCLRQRVLRRAARASCWVEDRMTLMNVTYQNNARAERILNEKASERVRSDVLK